MDNLDATLDALDHRAGARSDEARHIDRQVEPDQSVYYDDVALDARLKSLRILAAKAPELVELVEALPKQFQVPAFTEYLRRLLEEGAARQHASLDGDRDAKESISSASVNHMNRSAVAEDPMVRLAAALGAKTDSLLRIVQLDDHGDVQILVRVEGRSTRERQVRLAALVAYVREKAFGEMHTDVEMIRKVCVTHGAYDSANFSSNFKKDGSLRAVTMPGTNERRYVLAPEGVHVASNLFKQLLEG